MADFDIPALQRYLSANLADIGQLASVEKFADGQSNPTYLVRTSADQYVLRRQPFGELLKSAHAVDREFRVLEALAQVGFPVPVPIHLCEDKTVIGSLFYIMSYVDGRIFWDPALPHCANHERTEIYDQMNQVLVRLHEVDLEATGLETFGKPGNYFARQVDRWTRQYQSSQTERHPAMDDLSDWLHAEQPPDDGQISLIHGDFRIDNMIFSNRSSEIVALLDWELSTLGHPFADLAYQCMQWRLGSEDVIAGLGDHNRAKLGVPSEEEYIQLYCERRGLSPIAHWNYYLKFSYFRLAAILQGVYKRSLDGNASSPKAGSYGEMVPHLARMANEI